MGIAGHELSRRLYRNHPGWDVLLVAANVLVEQQRLGDRVQTLQEPRALGVGDVELELNVGTIGSVECERLGVEVNRGFRSGLSSRAASAMDCHSGSGSSMGSRPLL